MEVTKNKPYFDTLEKGQVLTVTITGGSAIVCGKIGTTEVLAENPTSTTIYGPYVSDIDFRVSYVSGVIDATESISSTPLFPQQITFAAFSAAQASGSLDTSAMYDVDGSLYRYNRVSGTWESVGSDAPKPTNIGIRYIGGGSPNVFNGSTIYTGASFTRTQGLTSQAFEVEGEFEEVEFLISNQSNTTSLYIDGMNCTAGDGDFTGNKAQNTGFASAVPVTFDGGSATVVLAARSSGTGGNSPNQKWSDKIRLSSVPRTDQLTAPAGTFRADGTLRPAIYCRVNHKLNDGVSANYQVTGLDRSGAGWLTEGGLVYAGNADALTSANATTQMTAAWESILESGAVARGFFGQNSGFRGYPVILGVRYTCRNRVMTVMYSGSSLTQSSSLSLRKNGGFSMRAALLESTAARPIETISYGMSSNTSTNAAIGALYGLGFFSPTHFVQELYNPNDIASGSLSVANMNAAFSTLRYNMLRVFNRVRELGGHCSFWNGYPRSTGTSSYYTAGNDLLRLQFIAEEVARLYPVPYVNANDVVKDTSAPQRLQSASIGFNPYSTDGLHIIDAGDDAILPVHREHLRKLAAAYFS